MGLLKGNGTNKTPLSFKSVKRIMQAYYYPFPMKLMVFDSSNVPEPLSRLVSEATYSGILETRREVLSGICQDHYCLDV